MIINKRVLLPSGGAAFLSTFKSSDGKNLITSDSSDIPTTGWNSAIIAYVGVGSITIQSAVPCITEIFVFKDGDYIQIIPYGAHGSIFESCAAITTISLSENKFIIESGGIFGKNLNYYGVFFNEE